MDFYILRKYVGNTSVGVSGFMIGPRYVYIDNEFRMESDVGGNQNSVRHETRTLLKARLFSRKDIAQAAFEYLHLDDEWEIVKGGLILNW